MNKTAFIIVDMLKDFVDEKGKVFFQRGKQIIPNVKKALSLSRENGKLIIYIQHCYRKNKFDRNLLNMRPCCIEGSGGEIITDELEIKKSDYVIKKRRYSAFFQTDLDLVLRENKIENIVLVGTKTNNCIQATALDGNYLDYNVYVLSDCVGTNDELTNDIYLENINKYIGSVITSKEYANKLETGEL